MVLDSQMENIDADLVVEIPDTPDRIAAQQTNGRRPSGKGIIYPSNGNYSRTLLRFPNHPINGEVECHKACNTSAEALPVTSSSNSQNGLLFRKTAVERNTVCTTKHPIGVQHKDKGKQFLTDVPRKSSSSLMNNDFVDLSQSNGSRDYPCGTLRDRPGNIIRFKIATNGSLPRGPDSSRPCNHSRKGKGKVDVSESRGADSTSNHGEEFNLSCSNSHRIENQVSSHHVTSPIVSRHKRLVRNGCISPHNIAARGKTSAEHQVSSKDIEVNQVNNLEFIEPIDISEIVREESTRDRRIEKRGMMFPRKIKEHDQNIAHRPTRGFAINATRDAIENVNIYSQGHTGWRSTRTNSMNVDPPALNVTGSVNQRHEVLSAAQTISDIWPKPDSHNDVNITKRQKRNRLNSGNDNQFPVAGSYDSDIVFLGSSGESSHSKSFELHSQGVAGPALEINELSPETRCNTHESTSSEAKARQLEADEILARELQERFYLEVQSNRRSEIDESIAWALQQEDAPIADESIAWTLQQEDGPTADESIAWALQQEDAPTAVYESQRHVSFPRSSRRLQRQPRSHAFQNVSRSARYARVPSTRTATSQSQLRGSAARRASPGEMNFQFPSNMDLETRLDILEALEEASDGVSDRRTRRTPGQGHFGQDATDNGYERFLSDRRRTRRSTFGQSPFGLATTGTDNDYELLLALDAHNHEHTGASTSQINTLPESKLQSDNIKESCAICLEVPAIGETIRHLPCLHRFHKDCIDPWLKRRTLCPVCKSSITSS